MGNARNEDYWRDNRPIRPGCPTPGVFAETRALYVGDYLNYLVEFIRVKISRKMVVSYARG